MGLVKQLFYRGQYPEVLQRTFSQASAVPVPIENDNMIYVVGSLSFLGRIREAEAVCDRHGIISHIRRLRIGAGKTGGHRAGNIAALQTPLITQRRRAGGRDAEGDVRTG